MAAKKTKNNTKTKKQDLNNLKSNLVKSSSTKKTNVSNNLDKLKELELLAKSNSNGLTENNKKINEKKRQKQEYKSLSREDRRKIKNRLKEIKKLNKPHNGPKKISFKNPDNIVELKDVNKYYTNGYIVNKILKDISLEIKRGDFVIILGPSGSGKTTLMNIISGLDRASTGKTNVCGIDLINLKDSELTKFRKENVGYVFQQYGLLPNLTVKENVEIGSNLQEDKSKRLNLEQILKSFGMWEHKDKFPHQLSGGQQQRVSIARAFAKNPIILFGDEPTGAIDEEMSKMVMKEFVQINKKFNTTVIIVTHNPIFEPLGTLLVKFKYGTIVSIKRNDHPKTVDELSWGS